MAEAGIYRGVPSPLRIAPAGLGLYALVGYDLVAAKRLTVRGVVGGGVPFAQPASAPSFEFLAKLTVGLLF